MPHRAAPGHACRNAAIAALITSAAASGADPHPEWTLFTPFFGSTTQLIDLDGNVVHTWPSDFLPAASVYLTDDGAIVRPANDPSVQPFGGPGVGGRIERIAWDGTIEWSYSNSDFEHVQHHDIEVLPNGNVLAIMWEYYLGTEAIAMGRDPSFWSGDVWSEAIYEIQPTGPTTGVVVWEWHVWDHLVQDFDPGKPNYGDPADHPTRIDINFGNANQDWLHWNAIDYNADLDQIVISCHGFDEIWIISHDPADDGDLLYRWGNPQAYGRGTALDKKLFSQHDPEWIPAGLPGAGNITIFNNGLERGYSSIDELDTGVNPDGTYDVPKTGPFGPAELAWTCDEINGSSFLDTFVSGAERLPNGNTLVCRGPGGLFLEIDENCNSVWSFSNGGTVFRSTRLGARDERLEGLLWRAGDANGDLMVDLEDLLIVLSQWNTPGPEGDLDGTGNVDFLDLLIVLTEWDL